jgi:hypothetical protein
MKRPDEVVIRHDPKPKPGWPCPRCYGQGHDSDGYGSWSPTETRYRAPTPCYLCKGKGRVNVTPLNESEEKA